MFRHCAARRAAATATAAASATTVSGEELSKFRALAASWHDPLGPLRTLHMLNPTRVAYIQRQHAAAGARRGAAPPPLPGRGSGALCGVRVLDVGCGGGILAEALARCGASVVGVEPCAESVACAEARRAGPALAGLDLRFVCGEASDAAAAHGAAFDVVVASEVLEHVARPAAFVAAAAACVAPGGVLVVSTLAKSLCAGAVYVAAAEYATGIVPKGTHDWEKFVPAADLARLGAEVGLETVDTCGIVAVPSLCRSVLWPPTLALDFVLVPSFHAGHYFWTGRKALTAVAPAGRA